MSEQANTRSDSWLATAFSMGPVILAVTRLASGRFVEVNERFLTTTGYTREEVLDRTPLEIGLWVDPGERADGLRRLREGQPVREVEAEFRMKNGQIRTCLMSAGLIELNGEACVLTALTDITERKQAEAALRESQDRLAGIVTSAMDAIITVDDHQRIVLFNRAAEQMFGYTAQELAGQSLERIIPVRFRLAHHRHIAQFGQTGVTNRAMGELGAISGLRADGSEFPIEAAISQIEAAGHKLYTVILRDITSRKQAEQERAELLEREHAARAAAEAAVRVRDTFVSTAAHELKTPLTVLQGNIQLLQRRQSRAALLPEHDQRLLRIIGEQAARLNRLIDVMLDISRLQTGQLTIMRAPLDISALVRRVADDIRPTLVQHTLSCDLPDTPLMVEGDELRLEQVLQNLLSNAVKYSPDGGSISVRAERQAERVCIAIADQGIGIPQANLPNLFKRFYRADNVDPQQISGMGIGLYVVRAIVELHGGQVGVVSAEAGGSTFTVCLPASS
jgi:PAS domain S-box-containing protein